MVVIVHLSACRSELQLPELRSSAVQAVAQSAMSTTITEADVSPKDVDSPQRLNDSDKHAGTGFFLPLAMRSSGPSSPHEHLNGRTRPCRRRNVSTPNIGLGNRAGDRSAYSSLRSNSSSNLRHGLRDIPDEHPRRFSMSIAEGFAANYADYRQVADVQAGPRAGSHLAAIPASAFNTHASAKAAALAATSSGQASRVVSLPQQLNLAAFTQLPRGLTQPVQQQNSTQHMARQHTAPVQLPAAITSSSTSPRCSGSGSSRMAALPARLAAQQEPAWSTTISPDALQTFYGPSTLQPVPGPVELLSAVDSSSNIGLMLMAMSNSSTPGLSETIGAAAAAAAAAQVAPVGTASAPSSSSGPAHSATPPPSSAPAAATPASSTPHIFSQVSLSTWAVREVPPTVTATDAEHVPADPSSSNLQESEEMIQKRIDELLLQKQLLQLRQQHKQQQALLQLQQEQQEQALQQQLQMLHLSPHASQQKQNSEPVLQQQQQVLQAQHSDASFTNMQQQVLQVQPSARSFTSMQSLQQQVLQVQPSNGSFTSLQNPQRQQQQQAMLQGQQGDQSMAQQKTPEQLQREMLQQQLQQLQLQQQQQQQLGVSAAPAGYVLPLTSAGLLVTASSGQACGAMPQLQPHRTGLVPYASSASSAFAGSASGGLQYSSWQDDVMPVMGAGNGSSFPDYNARMSIDAGANPAAGPASWGSGQQVNLGVLGSGLLSYNVLFGGPSGQPAVAVSAIPENEGAWSFDAGLTFNQ